MITSTTRPLFQVKIDLFDVKLVFLDEETGRVSWTVSVNRFSSEVLIDSRMCGWAAKNLDDALLFVVHETKDEKLAMALFEKHICDLPPKPKLDYLGI